MSVFINFSVWNILTTIKKRPLQRRQLKIGWTMRNCRSRSGKTNIGKVMNLLNNGWIGVSGNNPKIKKLIREQKFIFGGRILSNRGVTDRKITYSNCYCLTPPRILWNPSLMQVPDLRVHSVMVAGPELMSVISDPRVLRSTMPRKALQVLWASWIFTVTLPVL